MYAITHEGKALSPDGLITDIEGTPLLAADPDAYNKALEAQELEHFKSGPERIMAYVRMPKDGQCAKVNTWLGTELGNAWLGHRAYVGFGMHTYRRAVTVRIFGTLYHGWYFESSGDYCHLKRAKIQTGKYAATV